MKKFDFPTFWAEVQSRNRQELEAELEALWRTGFEEGANLCLGVLAQGISDLEGRLGNLTTEEQVALAKLHELRKATRQELGVPWSQLNP